MGALHEVAGRNGKDLPLDLRSNGYHPSRAQLGLKLNSEFEESCSSSSSRIPIVSQSDYQNKLVAGHRSLCGHGIPMHRGRGRRRARGRFQISEFGLNQTTSRFLSERRKRALYRCCKSGSLTRPEWDAICLGRVCAFSICFAFASTCGCGSAKSFLTDRHSKNQANSGAANSWQSTRADVSGSAVKLPESVRPISKTERQIWLQKTGSI